MKNYLVQRVQEADVDVEDDEGAAEAILVARETNDWTTVNTEADLISDA